MSYTHLTEEDRYVISHLNVAGFIWKAARGALAI